jgi:hypothetical protein
MPRDPEKRRKSNREWARRYRATKAGHEASREADRKFDATEKGRKRRQRYKTSNKGREASRRYRESHLLIKAGGLYLGVVAVTPEQRQQIRAFRAGQKEALNGR